LAIFAEVSEINGGWIYSIVAIYFVAELYIFDPYFSPKAAGKML
jgi:hypothetical protein